jgi:hypothetical protein
MKKEEFVIFGLVGAGEKTANIFADVFVASLPWYESYSRGLGIIFSHTVRLRLKGTKVTQFIRNRTKDQAQISLALPLAFEMCYKRDRKC